MFEIEIHFKPIESRITRIVIDLLEEKTLCADTLREQLDNSLTRVSDRYGSVDIQARGPRCEALQNGLYAEALHRDIDYEAFKPTGVEVLLFLKNGYLHELKIYKQNGADILEQPNKSNLIYIL